MRFQTNKARLILVLGFIGIGGALLTIASDLILIGKQGSAYNYLKMGTEIMAGITQWRITAGAFLGIFVMPLQIIGLITIYYGLKAAGRLAALLTVVPMAHALTMGIAFHISYAFLGAGWKLSYNLGLSNIILSGMMATFLGYWKILIIIMLAEIAFSSLCFAVIVIGGQTLYPRWMSVLNPFCVLLFMFPIVLVIPAPIGGFVAPAYLNMSTAVFLIFSTIIIYKRLKNIELVQK